jgi:hypothetical protein
MPHPDQPNWTPGRYAIERDVAVDPDDRVPASVVVRHPTAPFVRYLNVGADSEKKLRQIALEYLKTVRCEVPGLLDPDRASVLEKWLAALDREDPGDPRFGWLPLASPGTKSEHPMVSYRFDRFDEKTFVLLASERLSSESISQGFLASGFGLRVVGHLRKTKPPGPYLEFRISGFSASLPFGEYRTSGVVDLNAERLTMKQVSAWIGAAADRIEQALDLDRPVFTRLRLHGGPAGSWHFEVQGTSLDYASVVRSRGSDRGLGAAPHAFCVKGTLSKSGEVTDLALLDRTPQVAYATRAFLQDPASQGAPADARSRRPAREDAKLATTFRGKAPPLPSGPFTVTTGKLVRPPRPNTQPPPTPDASLIRCNAFGETSARVNLGRFFARLQQYGINVDAYFRIGHPDVKAVCRSGILPGPGKDGNAVNARVTLGSWGKSFFDQMGLADRPTITMHFALADLSRRSRNVRDSNDWVAAESLGIAADPRWFWHEVGHVLLAASVGELEFRFAHSAGDALAAIASDPHSKLGGGPARFATFPWVFVPRRHDRCTAQGWSWSGAMHRPAHLRAYPNRVPLKGYWSEQILSSSLFRLYRSVGGDAALVDHMDAHDPGRLSREAASDYVMYLIFKAIGLLGYAGAVPAHRPDHFVTALIDADVGTETFSTTVSAGTTPGPTYTRVGGCVHKVIRWAFEMQGLYAPENAFRNAPGEPPLVDVYIADGRPRQETCGYAETHYGPGSYAPISLDWTPGQAEPALWHATPEAIDDGANGVFVTVGNRGRETALGVTVKVWARPCPGPGVPPEWDPAPDAWTPCTIASSAPQDIASDKDASPGPARFGPFEIPASVPRPLVLFAMATCTDDRANTDPETNLPCARLPVPLADLVAGDNNLGLRYVPAQT